MKKQNYIVILIGVCCFVLDHWLKIGPNMGPDMHYSFVGAIISGVASAASGIYGSIAANKRRRDAEAEMKKKKQELEEWREAEMGTNYLDRADSRAALRRVFEYNKEAQKAADTNAIKRGMTDEAKVAQAAKLNGNYADAVSQIAGVGARHKDRVQEMYLNETRNLDNLKIQNMMDTSGIDSMVQGIAGAASAMGSAIDGFGGGKAAKIGGGAPQISQQQHTDLQNSQGLGTTAWGSSIAPDPNADRGIVPYKPI